MQYQPTETQHVNSHKFIIPSVSLFMTHRANAPYIAGQEVSSNGKEEPVFDTTKY